MKYEKCLVQVYEILNHLSEEEIVKLPEKVIKSIEEKKDKDYIWTYDETKELINQEIDRKTIAILSYINLEYLLSEEEREVILDMHDANREKLFSKIGTVNFNKIIKYEEERKIEENNNVTALVNLNKEKWYQKILRKIKQLFNK